MPLGQTFREVVKIALNLTAASVQERNLEGKEFASDGFFFFESSSYAYWEYMILLTEAIAAKLIT